MAQRRGSNSELVGFLRANAGHQGEECLPWPFGRDGKGYGITSYSGRRIGAHRAMCIIAHGDPPDADAMATHICGNGHLGCVNPRHIRWSNALGNARDKHAHGTTVQGERMWKAKFKADQIVSIRRDKRGTNAIARDYGCEPATISAIRTGRTWKSVPGGDDT
jgi:hypothetical protein